MGEGREGAENRQRPSPLSFSSLHTLIKRKQDLPVHPSLSCSTTNSLPLPVQEGVARLLQPPSQEQIDRLGEMRRVLCVDVLDSLVSGEGATRRRASEDEERRARRGEVKEVEERREGRRQSALTHRTSRCPARGVTVMRERDEYLKLTFRPFNALFPRLKKFSLAKRSSCLWSAPAKLSMICTICSVEGGSQMVSQNRAPRESQSTESQRSSSASKSNPHLGIWHILLSQ